MLIKKPDVSKNKSGTDNIPFSLKVGHLLCCKGEIESMSTLLTVIQIP